MSTQRNHGTLSRAPKSWFPYDRLVTFTHPVKELMIYPLVDAIDRKPGELLWNRRNDRPIPLQETKELLPLNAIFSTEFNQQTKNSQRTSTKQIQITHWTCAQAD